MDTVDKVYVMMFGISNIVAGGPIYDANKIRFLESKGWKVVVFPVDSGKVYIFDLAKYNGRSCDFVRYCPFLFTGRQIESFLNGMVSRIPKASRIVIETGTDYTALWGELLAEKIGAKHIVFLLDEKNENINRYSASFYEFKLKRNELASISEKSLNHIFSPYMKIDNPTRHVLKAWCSNSVRDIPTGLTEKFPKTDFLIGSIGRLDKGYVKDIVDSICAVADTVNDKSFGIVLIGGTNDTEVVKRIEEQIAQHVNVKLIVTGYIWPIPSSIFKAFDLFISAAGSARISADMNVTTIRLDVISYKPLGFIADPTNNVLVKSIHGENLADYIYQALVDKNTPEIINRQSPECLWKTICDDFENHLSFIEKSNNSREYYPVRTVWDHKIIHVVEKVLFAVIPFQNVIKLQKIYGKAIKRVKNAK